MPILTTCRLADPYGAHLIEIADYSRLDYVLNCSPGAVGVLELTLPTSFDASLLRRDGRIGVWRSINGAPPYLDNGAIYLIETFKYTATSTFVRAYHATGIMGRRIIAYYAGSTYTMKGPSPADDLIKAYWNENAGSGSTPVIRDGSTEQSDLSAYITQQANLSQGQSISKEASRRNLLEVATELAQSSTTLGTYLTFEIIAPTESTLELRTYAVARGVDRRVGTANPLILSESRGNLEQTEMTIDYHDEATFIVTGGVGDKINRMTGYALDLARMAVSPFGRIERFVDMSNTDVSATLYDEARGALRQSRAITSLTGTLTDTPSATRGIHFDLGDMVTAEDPRTQQQFDVRIDAIRETITPGEHSMQIAVQNQPITQERPAGQDVVDTLPHKTRVVLRSIS